jgi:pimeloyl-ACP methyl ester carboxylesterase
VTEARIEHATSADGTRIGFERVGQGPPLLVVHGGMGDRTRWGAVAADLGAGFDMLLVDRRGRGLSPDTDVPHALEREVEDIAAVVAAAGGPVRVLAHSFGGLVGLEAARTVPGIERMVVYEPPFDTPGARALEPDTTDRIAALTAAGDLDAALSLFMTEVVGVPAERQAALRGTPLWAARIAALPAFAQENRAVQSYRFDPQRFADVRVPIRFLLGTASPPALQASARAAHAAVPGSELVELPDQGHAAMDTAPDLFLRVVRDFLAT